MQRYVTIDVTLKTLFKKKAIMLKGRGLPDRPHQCDEEKRGTQGTRKKTGVAGPEESPQAKTRGRTVGKGLGRTISSSSEAGGDTEKRGIFLGFH